MTARRCARCGGTNVDHDGYCWGCEYQQRFVAPGGAPGGGGRPPGVAPPPGAARTSGAARVLTMIVAPIVTIVLIGCGFAAVFVFERADAVVRSYPPGTAPGEPAPSATVDPASAAACVVGAWRLTASEENLVLPGAGSALRGADAGQALHATGAGGTLTFDASGTGGFDHAGWRATAVSGGATVTITATGVERFRYYVGDGMIAFTEVTGAVGGVAESHGQRVWSGTLNSQRGVARTQLSCGGAVLTLIVPPGAGGPVRSETYARLG